MSKKVNALQATLTKSLMSAKSYLIKGVAVFEFRTLLKGASVAGLREAKKQSKGCFSDSRKRMFIGLRRRKRDPTENLFF